MCTVEEYWVRISRIPLFPDFATDDGDAIVCRTATNQPVRVTKPEVLGTNDKRAAAIEHYEMFYKPDRSSLN